jgi:hypothetical protein
VGTKAKTKFVLKEKVLYQRRVSIVGCNQIGTIIVAVKFLHIFFLLCKYINIERDIYINL